VTKSEYQELVEFLSVRFSRIDVRLDGIDARLDGHDSRFHNLEGEVRGWRVATELNADRIRILTEGLSALNDKVERGFGEMDRRFGEVDRRLDGIDLRLDRMDARFDGMDLRFDRVERQVAENRALIEGGRGGWS
jgi:tetrahydromethanopterin S-methyltransferase subunit G